MKKVGLINRDKFIRVRQNTSGFTKFGLYQTLHTHKVLAEISHAT